MFLPGDHSSLPPGANQPALALESLLAAKTATPPDNPLLPPLLAALAGNLRLFRCLGRKSALAAERLPLLTAPTGNLRLAAPAASAGNLRLLPPLAASARNL